VIWYQLLRRDPSAQVPVGAEWVEEFRPAGLTDTQAKVLRACMAARWEDRPRNAMLLSDQLAKVTVASAKPDESKLLRLEGLSGMHPLPAGMGGSSTTTMPKLMTNSVGMTFVRVKAGTFRMGAPDGEAGRRPADGPVHEVRLTRPFYLGVTPVTQGQYARVTDQNPSKFRPGPGGGSPDHPVETVSWDDAVRFCEVLNRTPAEVDAGRTYRLPSEAEWEFACRAGTDTAFSFGAKMTGKEGVCMTAGGGRYAGKSTAPVGQFPANPWGLHEMHGNVQEWCADWFDETYYARSPVIDPAGPSEGDERVIRGGCWSAFPTDCRSSARRSHAPNKAAETIGFRVVLEQA
jgi:formylglycine-generating enzyme required for sulfatase activity